MNEMPRDCGGDWCGRGLNFSAFSLSTDMMKQSLLLVQKPHVVVATPGRLSDHLQSTDTVSLDQIRFLVNSLCMCMNSIRFI